MKINLLGLIRSSCGCSAEFDRIYGGLVIDDNGQPLDAFQSLEALILEHAKVVSGGQSSLVVVRSKSATASENIDGPIKTEGKGLDLHQGTEISGITIF